MTKGESGNHSVSGPSRRLLLQSTATLLSLPIIANTTTAWAQEKLAAAAKSSSSAMAAPLPKVFGNPSMSRSPTLLDVICIGFAIWSTRPAWCIALTWGSAKSATTSTTFISGRLRDWDIAYIEAKAYPAMHKAAMFEPIACRLSLARYPCVRPAVPPPAFDVDRPLS
jgi:putative spermidine/putrescine transport system substrate-binding protein